MMLLLSLNANAPRVADDDLLHAPDLESANVDEVAVHVETGDPGLGKSER